MKVLYAAHTGRISGAERSLLDLLSLLPASIEPTVACPLGALKERVHALGIETVALPEIRGVGAGPGTALYEIGRAGVALRRRARATHADLVHAASVRAGLAAALAARLGGPEFVVDIRDCLPSGGASGAAQRLLARTSAMAMANSEHTAESFRAATGVSPRVVHPLVDLNPFLRAPLDREAARSLLGLNADAPVLAVVGQVTPWKAQTDAVRMLEGIQRTFPAAMLVIAGDVTFDAATRHDNRAYEASLRTIAAPLGDAVRFLGDRDDISTLLAAVDVLLVPSWDEPFGRVVIEGMASGVPVVATTVGGPPEILNDGVEGLLRPPREPERWTDEIVALLDDPDRRERIGAAGRSRALAFQKSRRDRLSTVLDVYGERSSSVEAVEAPSLV